MFVSKSTYWLFVFALLCFITTACKAQEVNDSALDNAAINVFDHPDRAIEVAQKVLASNETNAKKIRALLLLSNAYSSKSEYLKSTEYAIKAREISQKSGNVKTQLQVLNTIAMQYLLLGINNKALQFLDEADQIANTYSHKDSIRMILGNNYSIRGFIYKDQLSCEVAINYLNKAISQYKMEPTNPKMLANMSITNYHTGECFVAMNQKDSARANFQESLENAKKINSKSLEGYAQKGLAEVLTLESHYQESINLLYRIKKENNRIEPDAVLDLDIYLQLADNYLALDNWKQYQYYYDLYQKGKENLQKAKQKSVSRAIEKSLFEHQKTSQKRNTFFYIFIILSIISSLLLIVSIYIGQTKFHKKLQNLKNSLPQLQNKETHEQNTQ